MKKFLLILFAVLTIICFSACDNAPAIEKYYLDTNGNLIAEFEDGSTKDLGTLGDTIANGIEDIEINSDGYYVLNGIKTDIVAVEVYDVTFDTGFSTKVSKQTVKDGYKVERPEIERKGYILNGWYCNGEEWRFNSDVVKNDMVLTADWVANEYTISFDSNGAGEINSFTIKTGEELILPIPEKPLYTFDGWIYNGTKVTSSILFNFATNINLVASWSRTQYTITFDTAGGESIKPIKVDSFSQILELPIPSKSEFEFLGWFINDSKVDLPYDFTEGNLTLTAHWRGLSDGWEFVEDNNGADIKLLKYKGSDTEVSIPTTLGGKVVSTIGTECFSNNNTIKSIKFHSKVVNFEYKCIFGCNGLEEITISGDTNATLVYIFGSENNIPISLKTINFAKGSSTYGGYIFNEIISRTFKVNVFAELSTTPQDAFYECNAVSEIYFYGEVKNFSSRTICSNYNLQKVNIPNSVTSIGMNNFINCPKLEYIIVPKSVKSVSYGGLGATDSIILVEAESKNWGSNAYLIYENEMNIFYGFEEIKQNEKYIYALCSVGSVKKAIILDYLNGATSAEVPEMIDGYVVSYISK